MWRRRRARWRRRWQRPWLLVDVEAVACSLEAGKPIHPPDQWPGRIFLGFFLYFLFPFFLFSFLFYFSFCFLFFISLSGFSFSDILNFKFKN
jgi:hypothetical protein